MVHKHSNQSATQLTITGSLRSLPRDLPQKDGCCALVRNTQIHACSYAPSHIKLNNLLHSSSSVIILNIADPSLSTNWMLMTF